eukprot:TRINITY_DN73_c1_g3_i2.p1 TRINITY_DN73_c1_g3~~TRINITY_DN73_c1_g3_i2.p1  ORF type:complete len:833 (+),score=223.34 TRINITY_DN73_c1_g3_i2:99-2501(+)
MTEIGEKGVNLSGGQKQRVSIARAVYADHDIYLIDDPLSALDAHVGRELFNKCFKKLLKNKLILMVSHQLQYIPFVDHIFIMDNGMIQQSGSYSDLIEGGIDFAKVLGEAKFDKDSKQQHSESDSDSDWLLNSSSGSSSSTGIKRSSGSVMKHDKLKDKNNINNKDDSSSSSSSSKKQQPDGNKNKEDDDDDDDDNDDGKIIQEEEHYKGSVSLSVYLEYIRRVGPIWYLVLFVFVVLFAQVFDQGVSMWLSLWSDDKFSLTQTTYTMIYLGVALTFTIFVAARNFMWTKGCLDCAISLHEGLVSSVLRAPMSFFHKTPTGRILNRFSRDQATVDTHLPDQSCDVIICFMTTVSMMIFISVSMPWFIVAVIPLGITYYFLKNYFQSTSRELTRIQSINSSPIFAHFTESLNGLEVIRAFGSCDMLRHENERFLDDWSRIFFHLEASYRWMGYRCETLGAIITMLSTVIAFLTRDVLTDGKIGLVLTLASSITGYLNWLVRVGSTLESNMSNVERILQYSDTTPEADLINENHRPPPGWPYHGKIELKNVCMRYRQNQPLVLNDINLTINPQEKIGVVGRTGAGKSSLITVLFRLHEICGGTVEIDGMDISQFGLRDVRTNLSIIPQDPYLFSGTIRSNLDPFDLHSDPTLWDVLSQIHLKSFVENLPEKLSSPVNENGNNLSVGQRQLICIGRALLRNPKILVMDEATASVDNETDQIIQKTVREVFKDKTVITIAHRLNTIMDSDRILVMESGRVKEFDTPINLINDKSSMFFSLIQNTGYETSKHLIDMALSSKETKK